jgi:prophage regulatory protein
MQNNNEIKFYRLSQLKQQLSVSRSSIWAWVKEGSFPKPIKLGKNCTAWNADDIHAWVEERTSLSLKGGN